MLLMTAAGGAAPGGGGALVAQRPTAARPAPPTAAPAPGRLTGIVRDSLSGGVLAGAVVQVVPPDDPSRIRSVQTGADGRFVVDSLPAGLYLLGFLHPTLDDFGVEAALVQLQLAPGAVVDVELATPSPRTIVAMRCGPGDQGGVWLGVLRAAQGGSLTAPGRVRAQFTEVTVVGNRMERRSPNRFANATETGAFAVCQLPVDQPLRVRGFAGVDSSGVLELRIPGDGMLVRDLWVGRAEPVAPSARGDVGAQLRGAARLRGVVRDAQGKPMPSARVEVVGSGQGGATTTTGQFALQGLPAGSYMLEARALGFEPMRVPVDLVLTREASVEVTMAAATPKLDTLRVRGNADLWAVPPEFEQRRKSGFGRFIDPAWLEERKPQVMADIFRSTPGIVTMPGQMGREQVLMRGTGMTGSCVPAVFLNGLQIPMPDGNLDTVIQPMDVRAVEIYPRAASAPIQFQTRNGCGSIVIWSGARRPPGK
ncbi:MAG: carboxypeptidase regulatory-like domain-containing protein [Gemmatimonadetes bacterium]|nr:carboxypeptidase regulatory-like domain-containing protein [Gemmatimonadota bacterium]